MIGGGLCREVQQYVHDWIPERSYRSETKYQNDLQDYLDSRINESGGTGMGIGMGGNQAVPVKREYGQINADVAVSDEVGIELKRDFTNGQKHRLSGQIVEYKKEFPCVLVVACGITDIDGWRELQNEYEGAAGIGMGQGEVHFIHKQKEHFGSSGGGPGRDDGGLFGGSLF